jgi:hypothetical protein
MNKFFGRIKVSNETKTELNIVETLTKTKQKNIFNRVECDNESLILFRHFSL